MRARAALLAAVIVVLALPACATNRSLAPRCTGPQEAASILILEAQSVPTATRLPCIAEFPPGWRYGGSAIDHNGTILWLDHDRAGVQAVEVRLRASCDPGEAAEVAPDPDEQGMRVYRSTVSGAPLVGIRFAVFEGGCLMTAYRFDEGSQAALVVEADRAVSTVARADLVEGIGAEMGLAICGAGASCPG